MKCEIPSEYLQEQKPKPKTFVTWRLGDLVKCIYPEVTNMFYWIDKQTHDEYVKVEYKEVRIVGFDDNPRMMEHEGEFDICVTADSNQALVNDVLKAVGKRFG